MTRGDARAPLTDAELFDKFADCCATGGWSHDDATRLRDTLTALVAGGTVEDLTPALARNASRDERPITPTLSEKERRA